jgi:hypothetical protein
MRLQNGGSRSRYFSALASKIAGSTHLVKSAMRRRKVWRLRKRSLSGCLFCSIDIHHCPMRSQAVPHPTWWGSERRSCHKIFLRRACAAPPHLLDQARKKAGKRRGMRQVHSPKKCHERLGKRKESLRKGLQGSFSAYGVAHEHHDKINHLVVTHTSASKPHSLLDGFLEAKLAEHMS